MASSESLPTFILLRRNEAGVTVKYGSEANFEHKGRKTRETMTPTTVRGSLGDDFFDDIESCSIEPANLDEVTPFDVLPPLFFHKRRQSGPRYRTLTFFQIGEFNLMREATLIVDDNLLKVVTLAAKLCDATGQPSIGKDIDNVRSVTTPPVTTFMHESPTPSQHLVKGPTSLEMAARRLSSVYSPIAIPRVTGGKLARSIALPTTSFSPGPYTPGIIMVAIYVMGSEYLAALKKADPDAVEAKIQEAPMIYKGIERLCGYPTPCKKRWRIAGVQYLPTFL